MDPVKIVIAERQVGAEEPVKTHRMCQRASVMFPRSHYCSCCVTLHRQTWVIKRWPRVVLHADVLAGRFVVHPSI